jgi:hypothetical protein
MDRELSKVHAPVGEHDESGGEVLVRHLAGGVAGPADRVVALRAGLEAAAGG